MKIAVADNNSRKFTNDLIEHWISLGHEVKYEPGASEWLAQWADLYYIDTWDNNLGYLYRLYHGQHDQMPDNWDNSKKPIICVRALDWEVWLGHCRDQEMIDWVDKVICIAPHIEKELRAYGYNHTNFGKKLKCIRPGVNLDKFPLKSRETDGFQLGMCLGDMWKYKNHMGGLDIFTTLYRQDPRWRLHIRGQQENQTYDPVNWNHYLQSRGIEDVVYLYDPIEDMNFFYDQIDILLHPGQKEAFCYAVGEALAKGIPAVINDFYGSKDIWDPRLIYQTHEEAVNKILAINEVLEVHLPQGLRAYIQNNYSLERYFKETDEWLGI